MDGHRPPPPPPIITVLDANEDGVIDAAEIAKASESLKKLDKNGDGKLTREEIMPPRPGGPGGPGGRGGEGRRSGGRGPGGGSPGDDQQNQQGQTRQRPASE